MKTKVINFFEDSRFGGPHQYMYSIAKNNDDFLEFDFLISSKDLENFSFKLNSSNLNYTHININRLQKGFLNLFKYTIFFIPDVFKISMHLKKNPYDYIYICGGSWQIKGVLAGLISKTEVVWHLNDTYVPWLIRLVFSQLSRLVRFYIFASEKTFTYYKPVIKNLQDFEIIPSPIDINYFVPNSNDSEVKKNFYVVNVSNINPVKGLEEFILTAEKFNNDKPMVKFLNVGQVFSSQEKYFKSLNDLINKLKIKNLEFLGFSDNVKKILQDSDLYFCTSRKESSPISVWEAMAMKKPVISFKVGDVPKYVKDDVNGFIVDNHTEAEKKIRFFLKNREKVKEFGNESRKTIINNFKEEECFKKHKIFFSRNASSLEDN